MFSLQQRVKVLSRRRTLMKVDEEQNWIVLERRVHRIRWSIIGQLERECTFTKLKKCTHLRFWWLHLLRKVIERGYWTKKNRKSPCNTQRKQKRKKKKMPTTGTGKKSAWISFFRLTWERRASRIKKREEAPTFHILWTGNSPLPHFWWYKLFYVFTVSLADVGLMDWIVRKSMC